MAALSKFRATRPLVVLVAAALTVACASLPLFSADLRPGYRPVAYAIKGAKLVVAPGQTIDPGTVIVRAGVIEKVGKAEDVAVPFDAEVIEGNGLVVYPGFIDLYTTLGQAANTVRSETGAGRNVPYADFALASTPADNRSGLTPEFEMARALDLPENTAADRRKLGFTDLIAAPAGSIVTGQSALVSTSGLPRREAVVASPIGLHLALRPPYEPPSAPGPDDNPAVARRRFLNGLTGLGYPSSLMGVVAHLRQAMLDAQHDHALRVFYAQDPNAAGARLPFDPALQALYAAESGQLPVWWEANTRDEIHRALDLAEEFGTRTVIVGGREAGKATDRLKAQDVPVVLRLDWSDEPKVPSADEYRKKAAEDRPEPLRVLADHAATWKERVQTAQTLTKAGVRIAFSTDGLSKAETFHAQVRKAIELGLPADAAVAALTKNAAEIAGVGARLGTIAPGKLGHLVVLSGPFGDESAKVRYVLSDGLKFDLTEGASGEGKGGRSRSKKEDEPAKKAEAKPEPSKADDAEAKAKAEPAKSKDAEATKPKGEPAKTKDAEAAKPKSEAPKAKDEAPKAKAEAPKAKEADTAKPKEEKAAKPKEEPKAEVAKASEPAAAPAPAAPAPAQAQPGVPPPAQTQAGAAATTATQAQASGESAAKPKGETPAQTAAPAFVDTATELDEDRKPATHAGGNVLIKDATVLTAGPQGTLAKGSILIKQGKIVAVAPTVEAPEGVKVIDATGLVAMPGIIDTHSHMAISGGVNEMSLSITPEVRVRDVVNGDDPTIFRALAGGVTSARLLHGSANTIGGQDVVIKLRYGQPGRDLIVRDGAQGVKFALGENVTRRTGRFPNTRMGVEATIERAFEEGRAYQAEWNAYRDAKAKGENLPPPRRDLRLEAIAGVLDGSLKIHSHCYRSDEILMLLRTAARHGVRVQSLQHVLEGYKVAAEIAAHGASASTFSDWWAYKVEAFDAIPYNSALLAQAGVRVSIKSDDDELVRHLYLEAAKMVKYGAVPEAQALEMITMNPARQLGLEHRIGSLEPGKDGDVALFNAHPFDGFARCEMSLIDGEVYFERKEPEGKLATRSGEHAMPLASAEARGRTLEIAANPQGLYAITGATLHPVSAPNIENGTIVIAGGKISALGGPLMLIPPGAQTIDAKGLDVWPGLIDAGSLTGVFEVGSLAETQDYADIAQFQPELHISSAIKPDSELIPVTRANGVLTAIVQPSGGTISGQACAIELAGWVPSEMLVADDVGLVVNIPRQLPPAGSEGGGRRFREGPGRSGEGNADAAQARKDRLQAIREQFRQALAYDKVRAEARAQKASPPAPDPRLAALAPYARGEKPVIFHADRRGEILDALKIAADLKLRAVISGGLDAWQVADELKAAKVPVLVAGTLQLPPESTDPYDAPYCNPARLQAAGVLMAIRSGGRMPNQATASRNLPYEAATAVAYGLPEADALKAVTLAPAQILGIADRVGSLETGKRADIVITAGHILQPTTDVKALFIGGKPVAPESRHTQLYAKYQKRLAEVKAGTAPLGIDRPAATLASPSPAGPMPPGSAPGGTAPAAPAGATQPVNRR